MEFGRRNSTLPHTPPPPPASINSTHQQHNDDYSKSKSQWSFTLSRTIKKPIDVVLRNLGGLDNFAKLMMLNPVCLEYKEVGRDWVGPITSDSSGKLENARVREMIEVSQEDLMVLSDEEKKKKLYYRRIKFEGKDSVVAFCGLVSDVTEQKGTFVWDEEGRVGVWEVRALNPVGREDIDSWARKVIRFREDGDESTKIEEFVEGYSVEKFKFLEGVTKRFTKDLHKNWMKRYSDVFDD
ncbi:hypothetical protein AGABI1DRAFT_105105 [Agaricus bisporus var. burnettii JB137-S8]|uniref:Uncharacterized protein n=1 Tax=Agaricus bisporus var. burnettii (strain JB137-S8 / ATCC MYA-4627 / FGSC 10392) TaxID=597362 RepID=K5XDZ3_AGABU|nr:uncharacterized protein AGABI1DRAFT_105105 [Agaricus bisporus var. burnettii JB137-S8]EKM81553.1 hypothetical protein AGABI1DRAFT_105105 [Agaricus bisporus var. burnettii JB137-S8]